MQGFARAVWVIVAQTCKQYVMLWVQMFGGDVLESRFALLEGTSSVDDDLVKLKADMMSKGAYKSAALPEFSSAPPKKYTVDIFWP